MKCLRLHYLGWISLGVRTGDKRWRRTAHDDLTAARLGTASDMAIALDALRRYVGIACLLKGLAIDGFSRGKLHFAKIHSRSFAIMKRHQPTSPNNAFLGKSQLGSYSDSMLEMDYNIGRSMDVIRAVAPDTTIAVPPVPKTIQAH